jgi:glycosyltransferase involved in cell wall biosynthesis
MLLAKLTESLLAPSADAVIAVTPGRAAVMREMYPDISGPDLVPNYPPLASPAPRFDEVRRRLGVMREPCFLFLYQGILGLHRGLEQLIDASVMLKGLPIHVAFVGQDRSTGAIQRYAEERNAGDTVTFHPPVPSEELPGITGSADAGLLLFQDSCLNHTLSLPNKLFEYMMSGLPVLASDLPEISEVIREHDCGVLVNASDPVSIMEGMQKIASDPEEAETRGKRGLRAARENYCWRISAESLRKLYSQVLDEEFPPLQAEEGASQ